MQVVRHPEGSLSLSMRTANSAGRGQHGLLIISYCLKTNLPCPREQLFYDKHGKSDMFPLPLCANAIHFHVEVTLHKLSMYASPLLSQMIKDSYINAALTTSSTQGPLTTPRGIHPLMQGTSFTSSLQF